MQRCLANSGVIQYAAGMQFIVQSFTAYSVHTKCFTINYGFSDDSDDPDSPNLLAIAKMFDD